MNNIITALVLLMMAPACPSQKIMVKSQSDFDNIPNIVSSFASSCKETAKAKTLDIIICDGEYTLGVENISFSKPTHVNASIRIRAQHSGKTIIRSPYDTYSGPGTFTLKHSPEVFPCMVDDGAGNEIEFSKSGDATDKGVNFVSKQPVILNHSKHIAKLGIPKDMMNIANHPFTGDSLKANSYFKDCFMMVSTQWNRILARPLWSDSEYLYFDYVQDYNTMKGAGRFDEAYSKKTRFNIYNNLTDRTKGKITFYNGLVCSDIEKGIRVFHGQSKIRIENLNANEFKISGLVFSGITSESSFIIINNCSNVTIAGNEFRNFCSGLKNGYMVSINGKSSSLVRNISINNNRFINSKSSQLTISYIQDCEIAENEFILAGTYINGRCIGIDGCDNLYIHHNIFRDNPSTFIKCGGSSNEPHHVVIDSNEFWNTEEMNSRADELCAIDMGFVYFWGGRNLYRVFSNNSIHDVRGYTNNRALFIDDGAGNITVEGNVISGTRLNYSIDARYTKSETPGVGEKDVSVNNILKNNVVIGRVRWNGNKLIPGSSTVENNFIQLNVGETGNDFKYANESGDIYTDKNAKTENGKIIIHVQLPWSAAGTARKTVVKE